MQKSFKYLLNNLQYCTGNYTESHFLKYLTKDNFEKLKDLSLLSRGDDLKEIPCPSCDEGHFTPVRAENDKIYTVCPYEDDNHNYLEPIEVQTWVFDVEALLQQMTLKLNMIDQVESLTIKGMWQIGTFSKDDKHHICYFFRGKDFTKTLEFIKKQPANLRRYVIITCKQESDVLAMEHELLLIEATHFTNLHSGNLKFNKKTFENHLVSGFRNVNFNVKNGDLSANGEVIISITPSTPEFHFAELLWKKFNLPQTYQIIVSYIYKKTGKEYDELRDKVCQKMKHKIKKTAKKPEIIDQIFKTTKDENGENGYIMKNPT